MLIFYFEIIIYVHVFDKNYIHYMWSFIRPKKKLKVIASEIMKWCLPKTYVIITMLPEH